jgi:hypothetical protein
LHSALAVPALAHLFAHLLAFGGVLYHKPVLGAGYGRNFDTLIHYFRVLHIHPITLYRITDSCFLPQTLLTLSVIR